MYLISNNSRNFNEYLFPSTTNLKGIYAKTEYFWSYLGKIVLLTRHLLNATSRSSRLVPMLGDNFPQKVVKMTTRLKLFSIVGVPFSLVSLKSISEKIFKSYSLNDKEAVALGSLAFTITSIDAFDSTATFANTVLLLSARSPIARLSALGMPCGFAMTGLGIISRIGHIAQSCRIYYSLSDIRKKMLEAYLEEQLGINERQALLAAPFTEKTFRAAPGEVEVKLRQLYNLITAHRTERLTDQEKNEISHILDAIQTLLKKKVFLDGLGISANCLSLSALCLFCLGSLNSTPFWLLSGSFFIRISSLMVQEFN
ncbi:MAG: hypothetical protein LW832_01515 [Parachlamydia sp.]|jgi:hypothetical protein|nr:hypothetical protein [Parachlamydia sp.]